MAELDKFLAPLGSLKTEVGGNSAVEVGGENGPVVKVGGEGSVVELGGEGSVVKLAATQTTVHLLAIVEKTPEQMAGSSRRRVTRPGVACWRS
jgi:hypothetical protein